MKINVCLLLSFIFFNVSQAQDFFLDSVYNEYSTGLFNESKYHYNPDNTIKKIVTDDYTYNYAYPDILTTNIIKNVKSTGEKLERKEYKTLNDKVISIVYLEVNDIGVEEEFYGDWYEYEDGLLIKHRRDRTYTIDNYKGYFNDFVKEYECNNEGNLTLETESIYVGGTVTIKNEWEGDLLVKKISVWDYAYDYITDTTEFSYIDGINKWESLTKEYFNESSPACDSVFFKIPSL